MSNRKFELFQSAQHDLVKIAPMAALTGADIGKSSLFSRSAHPDPKSRYDDNDNAMLYSTKPYNVQGDPSG